MIADVKLGQPSLGGQKGFTLLEVLAVAIILAVLSSMSLLAINQAFDRRYYSHAEKLLIWLQELSEQASLTGVVYGVIHTSSLAGEKLQPVVYYSNDWLLTTSMSPFTLDTKAYADWGVRNDPKTVTEFDKALETRSSSGREPDYLDKDMLPIIAFMPDGYMEPEVKLKLRFPELGYIFAYSWDDANSRVQMRKVDY